MALRDTLRRLAERSDDEAQPDRTILLEEWRRSLGRLNEQIESWLADYALDGVVAFDHDVVEIEESDLGVYVAPGLTIKAGPTFVRLQPIARFVVGGMGRVDMYRQGRSSDSHRIRLLRSEGDQWRLRRLDPDRSSDGFAPLTRASFEAALDSLLV